MSIWAYVDSGASFSVFSQTSCERLGLVMDRGDRTNIVVGDGSLIPVYVHRLPVRIGRIKLTAHVGFSPRLGVGFDLLGRQDIFTRFDVTFSDATRTLTFHPRLQ